jgi:hypothetical protein
MTVLPLEEIRRRYAAASFNRLTRSALVQKLAVENDVPIQCIEAIVAGRPWRKYLAEGGADLLARRPR